jgi:hypothetical protein
VDAEEYVLPLDEAAPPESFFLMILELEGYDAAFPLDAGVEPDEREDEEVIPGREPEVEPVEREGEVLMADLEVEVDFSEGA